MKNARFLMKNWQEDYRRKWIEWRVRISNEFIQLILIQENTYLAFNSVIFLDELREEKEKYKALCDDIDLTFSEMTGY